MSLRELVPQTVCEVELPDVAATALWEFADAVGILNSPTVHPDQLKKISLFPPLQRHRPHHGRVTISKLGSRSPVPRKPMLSTAAQTLNRTSRSNRNPKEYVP